METETTTSGAPLPNTTQTASSDFLAPTCGQHFVRRNLILALLATVSFALNYYLELRFDRLKVFDQYNVLFDADPNEAMAALVDASGGRGYKHPDFAYFLHPLVRSAAKALSKLQLTTQNEIQLRRQALLAVPLLGAAKTIVLFLFFLELGASILNIPFREMLFDKVLCLGVIQHTPDPEKTFKRLCEQVRPGGELVIDVYARTSHHWFQWKYLLRPITTKMEKRLLYALISKTVPLLLPMAICLKKITGRLGGRLLPFVEYSHLRLSLELNRQWAILDTFDMYSPAHDHPQSTSTIQKWYLEAGSLT